MNIEANTDLLELVRHHKPQKGSLKKYWFHLNNGADPNVPTLRSVVVVRYNISRTKYNWLIK